MIIVRPIQRLETADNFIASALAGPKYTEWPKLAKDKANTELPSIITAYDPEEPELFGTWGFKSRQTSYTTEIQYWGGGNEKLLMEALKGIIYASILEGRKRVEVFHKVGTPGFKTLQQLFRFEGTHRDYTEDLETVDIFSYLWRDDGIPQPASDAQHFVINNIRVNAYLEKNIALYAKDLDLLREDESGTTFARRIVEAREQVSKITTAVNIPDWHGKKTIAEVRELTSNAY